MRATWSGTGPAEDPTGSRKVRAPGKALLVLLGAGAAALMTTGAVMTFAEGPLASASTPTTHRYAGVAQSGSATPSLPGSVVEVTVTDMGAMMGGSRAGGMAGQVPRGMAGDHAPGASFGPMRLFLGARSVPSGTVSIRVRNAGSRTHEVVVLPLTASEQVGQRRVGPDRAVEESASVGEASNSGGADHGDGIRPGATGWTTLHLAAGRYDLICNLPGHYAAGMFAELDVAGP